MENTTEQLQETVEQPTEQPTEQPVEQVATETATEPQTDVAEPTTEPTAEPAPEPEIEPFEIPQQQQEEEEVTPETVVSKFDKQVLLKALGYDGHALKVLDLLNTPDGLAEYAKVMSVDYDKIPDEKILEAKLREQYASMGLSEEELSLLVDDELQGRYKQDADLYSEREVQLGKIRLKADAAAQRQSLKTKQSEWKWDTPAPQPQESPEQVQEKQKQAFEQARQTVLSDEAIKPILTGKVVKFGDYSHNLTNPQETVAMLYDNNRYLYNVAKKDEQGKVMVQNGNPVLDYSKLAKLAAYAQDMDNIEKGLIAHGEALAKKKLLDENENVVLEKGASADSAPDDVFQALNRKLIQR